MTNDEFIQLVKKMRTAQLGFFLSDRNSPKRLEYMKESKQLERQVDKAIKDLESNQLNILL